jgi:glycosyltransferase involved in cell wall biosynthesis
LVESRSDSESLNVFYSVTIPTFFSRNALSARSDSLTWLVAPQPESWCLSPVHSAESEASRRSIAPCCMLWTSLLPSTDGAFRYFRYLDTEQAPGADSYLPSGLSEVVGFSGNRIQFAWFACRASRSADIVIIGHANLLPLAELMNGSFKCLVAHGIEVWKELSRVQKRNARRMDRVLCVSAYTKREMMRLNGIAEDHFRVFPNTLDVVYTQDGHLRLGREVLGLPEGPMLLSVSRLAPSERYKNIRVTIESPPAVLQQAPEAFYVIVRDGPERKVF